ncbi:unnamed protein product [Oppiella nova]|uniref:Uncharacterized protein n=1 Tax=Oppiella nova TaxID=334625 RepID=A0A7R9QJI5_9ACAR|nr:unnamed protein product [Oppiella nova]CAG2166254.1 unnamed protein product [Oppiella nova]
MNSNLSVHSLQHLSDTNHTVVTIETPEEQIHLISAYHPPHVDNTELIQKLVDIIDGLQNKNFCIGIDANAKSGAWGLLPHQVEDNRGTNMCELMSSSRQLSFIDLTLVGRSLLHRTGEWMVSEEESMSDHRYIDFEIEIGRRPQNQRSLSRKYCTIRADWDLFRDLIVAKKLSLSETIEDIDSMDATETAAQTLMTAICETADKAIPKSRACERSVIWWTPELTIQRSEVRELRQISNEANETTREAKREAYVRAFNKYKTAIKKAKHKSFQDFITNSSTADPFGLAYKMFRLKRKTSAPLKSLQRPDQTFTETETETSAFDSAKWHHILAALRSHDCPRNLYQLIRHYLSDRSAVYETEAHRHKRVVTQGAMQGTPAGPHLWNALYDGLLQVSLPEGAQLQAYADDALLVVNGINQREIETILAEALQTICDWSHKYGIRLNPEKSQAMQFWRPKQRKSGKFIDRKAPRNPMCRYDGKPIKFVRYPETIRYLGVHIDPKLDFERHINKVCATAREAITKLSAIARVTWGLTPDSLRTIYMRAIEPALLYALPVWADRAVILSNKCKLSSVQRYALIRANQAYRTAPTDSLCVLANVLPIELRVAQLAAEYRLRSQSTTDDTNELIARFTETLDFTSIEPRVQYYFRVHPGMRPQIDTNEFPADVNIYTDGSKDDTKTSAAFVSYEDIEETEFQFRLEKQCSVFQAEMVAIREALIYVLDRGLTSVCLYTDSLSSIMALKDHDSTHPLVCKIWDLLTELYRRQTRIAFIKVAAHTGVPGNERADSLAKSAPETDHKAYGMRSVLNCKTHIRDKAREKWEEIWRSSETRGLAKALFPTIKSRISAKVYKMGHYVTQALTGHGQYDQYLHRIGVKESADCRVCGAEDTARHRLFVCQRFETERQQFEETFGKELNESKSQPIVGFETERQQFEETFGKELNEESIREVTETKESFEAFIQLAKDISPIDLMREETTIS